MEEGAEVIETQIIIVLTEVSISKIYSKEINNTKTTLVRLSFLHRTRLLCVNCVTKEVTLP